MERYDHVHLKGCLIAVNVSQLKVQILISVFCSCFVAFFYYILLKVQSDDVCPDASYFSQVIVNHEGQIGLAASKINYVQMISLQFSYLIIKDLQKAIYLPELIIHGFDDFSLTGKNPHIHQRRYLLPFAYNIILGTVVSQAYISFLITLQGSFFLCKIPLL